MFPVITVRGRTIPEVWEKSIIEVWEKGVIIDTEYGEKSKDCVMIMIVEKPLKEPRIHRAGLVIGKLEDLELYVKEVIDGIRDYLVKLGKISYTYHERLFSYSLNSTVVDQINYIVEKLSKAPFSRRAQAITWKPWVDTLSNDPPCLQRIYCRIYNDRLIMQTMWRSRDAFKAAFMNMYALTLLQKKIAERISAKIGRKIEVGEYIDISNSYHIYESDWKRVEKFLEVIKSRPWSSRVWTTDQYLKYVKLASSTKYLQSNVR